MSIKYKISSTIIILTFSSICSIGGAQTLRASRSINVDIPGRIISEIRGPAYVETIVRASVPTALIRTITGTTLGGSNLRNTSGVRVGIPQLGTYTFKWTVKVVSDGNGGKAIALDMSYEKVVLTQSSGELESTHIVMAPPLVEECFQDPTGTEIP